MTDKQEKDFKKRRFNSVWKEMAKDDKINYEECMQML